MTILMTATISAFYLTMKLLWGERPTNWVKILLNLFVHDCNRFRFIFIIKLSGMDSRYLLSSFRYRSHGLLYVQVSIIFSPFLSLTIIHSSRNKNQDLGAAESRQVIWFWDGDTIRYDGMKNNEGFYLLIEILTDDN